MELIVQKRYEKRGAPLDFMMYPTTVKTLAAEINNACDAYISRKIGTEELRKLILHYAENYPDMLFNTQDLNPTVLNRIGEKRTKLVNKNDSRLSAKTLMYQIDSQKKTCGFDG